MTPFGIIDDINANCIRGRVKLPSASPDSAQFFIVIANFAYRILPTFISPFFSEESDGEVLFHFSVPTHDVLSAGFPSAPPDWFKEDRLAALTLDRTVLCVKIIKLYDADISLYSSDGWCTIRANTDRHISNMQFEIRIDGIHYVTFSLNTSTIENSDAAFFTGTYSFPLPFPHQDTDFHELTVFQTDRLRKLLKLTTVLDISSFREMASLTRLRVPPSATGTRAITIIIPIFNAFEHFSRCIESILQHTDCPSKIICVNDASTDPRISSFLEKIENIDCITVINLNRNIGYTRAVNLAMKHDDKSDVVILNSDTAVGPRWLSNLKIAAYSDVNIATVTPFSNNAGPFSVEVDLMDGSRARLDALCRSIAQHSLSLFPSTPTAHGFCMYIRRKAIDEIGAFDEKAFPIGYGEENDFSMRANKAGWRNVIDDRTFVFHARSASFGAFERERLTLAARKVIATRYPEYDSLITDLLENNAALQMAKFRAHMAGTDAKMRVLSVISTETGGTPHTNRDLQAGIAAQADMLVFRSDGRVLNISDREGRSLRHHRLLEPMNIGTHVSAEYNEVVQRWIIELAIEVIHIRHIAWHSLSLPWIAQALRIPVLYSFHDYYSICPSLKLLDGDFKYCGGVCTPSRVPCVPDLWDRHISPPLKHRFVHSWKEMMQDTLKACDAFVTTSLSAKDLLTSHYPWLQSRPFHVIPHGRDVTMAHLAAAFPPAKGKATRLLAPGNISVAKGGALLLDLAHRQESAEIEVHVAGATIGEIKQSTLRTTGPYDRDQFSEIVGAIRPHFGLILSIWPETYSHTLTELWSCGIPVIAFDLGAVGERIRESGGGWLLAAGAGASEITKLIDHLRRHPAEYEAHSSQVRKWQAGAGASRNIDYMSSAYLDIYRDIVDGKSLHGAYILE